MAAASAPASTSSRACDLRVASADAFFQVAEVDVAITADLGTLQRLGYLIPQGVLRELTYTGRRIGAEEAARFGLVNGVEADRDAAIAAGLALARTIAAKSPLAVAGAKQSLNYSRGRPVEEGLRDVALWNAAALASGGPRRGGPRPARQDRGPLPAARRLGARGSARSTKMSPARPGRKRCACSQRVDRPVSAPMTDQPTMT